MSRLAVLFLALVTIMAAAIARADEGATAQGAKLFGACTACHSLAPDRNMTGPSLAGVWGRKAGSLKSFERYSPALKGSDVVWGEETLDQWLRSPAGFIPGNSMTFAGISDARQRAELIAFLKEASSGRVRLPAAMTAPPFEDLKKLGREHQVETIRYCHDTYTVTTADGHTADFWEANLRFKTDSSGTGPLAGKPIITPAGMMGDRASVFFAAPEEIGAFVKHQC
jgi:cytochrome c